MAIRIMLDEILRGKNMTSKQLCEKVGITEANMSILRSGRAKGLRLSTLNRLCYFLDCEAGDLLKFDGRLEDEDDEEE